MGKTITGSTFWHFSPLFPISPHFHLASPLFLFHPHATESEGEMFGQMRVKKKRKVSVLEARFTSVPLSPSSKG